MARNRLDSPAPSRAVPPLLRHLRERGVEVAPLLRGLGLPASAADRDDVALTPDAFEALLDAAARAIGDPLFALRLPAAMSPGPVHVAELAVASSPTLREAFERTARYATLFYAHLGYACETDDRELRIRHRSTGPQAARFALGSLLYHARRLSPDPLAPTRVWFADPRPAPDELDALRAHFGTADVTFGHADAGLAFDGPSVDRRSTAGDPRLHATADQWAERALAEVQAPSSVAASVRAVLRAVPGPLPASAVARRLGLSARTLQRRLADEGTTFTRVADDARRDEVTRLLRDTALTLAEIASRTGFADDAALTRAFRRWTGGPPGAWRRAHQADRG